MSPRLAIAARQIGGLSGMTGIVLEHTHRLGASGWEVHLFAERLDARRIRAAGGVPHTVPRWPWGRHANRRFFAWACQRALRGGCFDLVWGQGDLLAQDVLSLHNCVHAAHEAVHAAPLPPSSGVGALHERVLRERRFRLLIANSNLTAREVEQRFGVPPGMVRVVYPGYDAARFHPAGREALGAPLRGELGIAADEVLVGLVTSGDFAKRGVKPFLEALSLLPEEVRRRTRAVVVGHESRLEAYREAAARAGVTERVRFLEPMAHVERCYHALDVCVHPALYEEFGMTVLEAMACGVPVLTSARVGASELLAAEAPDLVLAGPEPRALAEQLARLVRDEALRRTWSACGLRASRGRDWDANFQATRACLESLRPAAVERPRA